MSPASPSSPSPSSGACFALTAERQARFDAAILSLLENPFANPEFFTQHQIDALITATHALQFRTARPSSGHNVHQDFEICFPAPLTNLFAQTANMIETALCRFRQKHAWHDALFDDVFSINDFAVQKYPPGSKGIGIHKDSQRYRLLIFIITLAGRSELFIAQDRDGRGRQLIDDSPGRLVILPAPGFAGLKTEADRPLHGVDHVYDGGHGGGQGGRLSIGFRYFADATKKACQADIKGA